MAYRRRQGMSRASTFKEEIHTNNNHNPILSSSLSFTPSSSSSSSLAAQAIKASASRHDPSLSFSFSSDHQRSKSFDTYGAGLESGESKNGFWGVLAQKAKDILDDEIASPREQNDIMPNKLKSYSFKTFTPSALAHDGKNEVKVKVDETMQQQSPNSHTIHQTQLKASRDVAMATAAKAKLLFRELKTVKADLAFAKERCSQLEQENKLLREGDKGQNRADDDLIRLQLETLLAEKARLANENETYSRENRFLREIVEYHQLTMQDVVYLDADDEGMEEVNQLYPIHHAPVISMPSTLPNGNPTFPIPQQVDQEEDHNNLKNTTSQDDEAPPLLSDDHHSK